MARAGLVVGVGIDSHADGGSSASRADHLAREIARHLQPPLPYLKMHAEQLEPPVNLDVREHHTMACGVRSVEALVAAAEGAL